MNFFDKLLAGIYCIQLDGNRDSLSNFSFTIARFTLVVPFGLVLVLILVLLSETINPGMAHLMPNTRLSSAVMLFTLIGASYLFTSSNAKIFSVLAQFDDSELNRYNSYYRYLLYGGAAVFIFTVFALK